MATSKAAVSRTTCLLVALAFTLLLFGDVVFRRASLAPIDYAEPLQNPELAPITRSLLPERPGRLISAGQGDIGSGAFQFEPAQGFMAYCLRHGESPFWDPYTGTGALGPETSAELKFSPVTVLTALLGGSSRDLCFVLIASYFAAAYALVRACTYYLHLSLAAGTIATAAYFLNGFALSNLYNPIGQPYFLAPLLLLSTLAVTSLITPVNVSCALATYVLFFATTFFPITVLCMIVIFAFTLSWNLFAGRGRIPEVIALHIGLPLTAVLLLSFLYFPIFAAMRGDLDMVKQYNARATPGLNLVNLLSFFTPKHFWESYHALYSGVKIPDIYNPWVHHLGIIAPLIAAHAFSRRSKASRAVLIALGSCIAVAAGQIWGIFPFTLIDRLPFFSFIRNEYWSAMVVLALVLLVAYGYDAITSGNALNLPSLLVVGTMMVAFFIVATRSDVPMSSWARPYLFTFWGILVGSLSILGLARIPGATIWSRRLLLFALIAEGLFYMNGLRPYRSNRDQRLSPVILWVKSEIQRHPGARLLNIGLSGVFPNWGSALQIPELGSLNTASFPWYRSFFYPYIGSGLFLSLAHNDDTFTFTDASLSLAGVRFIMVDRTFDRAIRRLNELGYSVAQSDSIRLVFENPHALSRSFLVSSLVLGDGLLSDLDLSGKLAATSTDEKLFSAAAVLALPKHREPSLVNSWSTVEEYHHDRVRIHCKSAQPALLVLTDCWSPRWKASVDGKDAYIGRVDVTFRGIALPPGEHDVVFWYQPFSLVLGETVSVSVLAGLCVTFLLWIRSRNQEISPGRTMQRHATAH